MKLFVVNRYEGEEEVKTTNEKGHLSELLRRIEERKRERAAKNENPISQEDSSVTEEVRHKKRKKEKAECNESLTVDKITDNKHENESCTDLSRTPDDSQQLRKKKRRKKNAENKQDASAIHETFENKEQVDVSSKKDRISSKSVDLNNVQDKLPEKQNDFMILGSKTQAKKREVKRVLPDWLAHPELVSVDLNSGPTLEELGLNLDPKLIEVLRSNGINKLFPAQASMISWLMKCDKDRKQGWWPRDTCVSAPTGSGKTLAYVLPIVQLLQSRLVPKVRCLVVVPVKELAVQVYKVMTTYTSHTSLRVGLLSGALPFEQEQNNILKKTRRGCSISAVDIIVATPGRLIDHILKTPGFSLNDLKFLVIDEADRAGDWLKYLPQHHSRAPRLTLMNLRCSDAPVQKLLFSATLSQDPEKLSRLGLFQPILFTSVLVTGKDGDVNLDNEIGDFVGRYTSPEELTELAVECTAEYKPVALYQLLTRNETIMKVLVFTNSGEMAHRLALLLRSFLSEKNVVVGELSAQLAPKQREVVLEKFAAGEIHVLVSSDALARGVDVPDVQMVISYDLPKHIKGYIHRAGRTGRAGKSGTAISVLTSNQVAIFKHMLNNAHKKTPIIEKMDLEVAATTIGYQSHVEKLKEVLEKEKEDNLQRAKAEKRMRPKGVGTK